MGPLRAWLEWLGHDARHWGLGVNRGDLGGDGRRLAQRVEDIAQETGRRVHLVGWSLGGVVSRRVARLVPASVGHVITYGSPVVEGRSRVTSVTGDVNEAERAPRHGRVQDDDERMSPPVTAIFTRRDQVVAWQSCIDRSNPRVCHVEVSSTHLSLGIDPDVWLTVARTLATDPNAVTVPV